MDSKQILLFNGLKLDQLQSYIDKINEITNTVNEIFANSPEDQQGLDIGQYEDYANALADIEPKQAALLLHTQGLTNAQIQQTLAIKGLTTAQQYEAMATAGLLKSKVSLTAAEAHAAIQKAFSTEMSEADAVAKANETMASLGLSAALQGEGNETVKLTAKKIAQLVEQRKLTQAQAEAIAVHLGLTNAMRTQTASTMPTWIANIKSMTSATWLQVKATVAWLATNPVTWCAAATAGIITFISWIQRNEKSLKEMQNALDETQNSISKYEDEISTLENKIKDVDDQIAEIGNNPLNIVDQNTLSTLRQTKIELQEQLELVKELNNTAKEIAQVQTIQILANTSKITSLEKALNNLKSGNIGEAISSIDVGTFGIINSIRKLYDRDFKGAAESFLKGIDPLSGFDLFVNRKENEKSIFEETTEQIEKLKESRDALNTLNDNRLNQSISEDKYQKDLSKLNEEISEQTTALLTNIKALQAYKEQLDKTDPEQADWIAKIDKTIDSYTASLVHKDGYRTFDDILSSDVYGSYKDELIELAKQGKLTSEVMENDYHNLNVLFEALSLSVDNVAEKLRQMGDEAKETQASFSTETTPAFLISEDDVKVLNDYQSNIEKIASALRSFSSMNTGEIISLMTSFSDYAYIFKEFGVTGAKGVGDLEGALNKLASTITSTAKSSVPQMADAMNSFFNEAFNGTETIAQLNSDIDELDAAIVKVSSGQSLNANEISTLINKYDSLSKAVKVTVDGYTIEIDVLKDLKGSKIDESRTAITFQIEQTERVIEQIKKRIEAYKIEKQALDEMTRAYTSNQFRNIEDYISKYGEMAAYDVFGSDTIDEYYKNQISVAELNVQTQKLDKLKDSLNKLGSGSSYTSSKSKEKKESEPTIFDWIETRIERANEAIDSLNKKLESVSDYTYQNQYIDETLQAYEKEIQLLEESKQKYLEKAEAVGLSAAYIEKIKDGTMLIEPVDNETTKKKIEEYKKWYEKAKDVDSSIGDILDKTKELKYQKLDNLIDDFDRVTSLTEAYNSYLQKLLDVKEAKNDTVTESDYLSLIQQELNLQATLKDQYQRVQAEFDKLNLTPADDKWYDYKKQLVDIQTQMEDCTISVENFRDAILDIRWGSFETGTSLLDDLADEISDVISLLGNGDMFDSAGEITDLGITKIGLYAQQYVTAKKQIAEYENAIQKLGEMYKNGLYSQEEYTQKLIEFRKASRDAALAVKDAKKEILDYHKEAIQAEIDAMKELIDSKKKALDAEKALDDYRKKIADKQKNIQSLEKKIATLALSDARADKALKLQLEEELAKAKEELADEEREHSIENQKDALDKEYENFEKEKNDKIKELENNLDKQEDLIKKYLNNVVDNYDIVYDNIQQISDKFGITFTESLTSPWENAMSAAQLYAQAVGNIMSQLNINSGSIGAGMTGNTLGTTNGQGQWIQETNQNSPNYQRWWYKHADGSYTQADWEKIDNTWYCFDKDGWMGQNEWVRGKAGEWYYLGPDGAMLHSGWKVIDGKDYCFDDQGRLYQKGYTPDGYMVDANGVWDKSIPQTNDPELIKNKAASFDHYRKGTIKVTDTGFAYVDENGEEMVLRPDENGRLDFLTKGTGVIPADMTKRLMNIAYDPASLLNDLPDIRNLSNIQFEKAQKNEQPVNVNITSPLIHVEGGLDSSIMNAVEKRINRIPDDIKQQLKSLGLR